MKAIVSSTNDPKYSFFLPIVAWCWNKLNVDVICFVPGNVSVLTKFAMDTMNFKAKNRNLSYGFICPAHKEATYAQCSRLYAAALDLPEDEVLISSDVDMAVFSPYLFTKDAAIDVFGADLTPPGQVPICYISATVKDWRNFMEIDGRSYQQCLDDLLGHIECDHFRGNFWSKDQEEAYNKISKSTLSKQFHNRAREGTQFASRRLDRDDAYLLERLNPNIIDFHLPRPGYEENNFNQILTVLKYFYPTDSFDWLKQYREQYISLL